MRWPWSRRVERRAGYTDAVVAALVSHAGAGVLSEARSTAALEAAAGAVARGFAAATVEDAPPVVTDALVRQNRQSLARGRKTVLAPIAGPVLKRAEIAGKRTASAALLQDRLAQPLDRVGVKLVKANLHGTTCSPHHSLSQLWTGVRPPAGPARRYRRGRARLPRGTRCGPRCGPASRPCRMIAPTRSARLPPK